MIQKHVKVIGCFIWLKILDCNETCLGCNDFYSDCVKCASGYNAHKEYVSNYSNYTKSIVCYKYCPITYIALNYECVCRKGFSDNGTFCISKLL